MIYFVVEVPFCSSIHHNNNYILLVSVVVELCSTTDVRDKDNKTPLHWACVRGSKDVVQYLVEERKMDLGEIIDKGERKVN